MSINFNKYVIIETNTLRNLKNLLISIINRSNQNFQFNNQKYQTNNQDY